MPPPLPPIPLELEEAVEEDEEDEEDEEPPPAPPVPSPGFTSVGALIKEQPVARRKPLRRVVPTKNQSLFMAASYQP
jgi:hypothetical protein